MKFLDRFAAACATPTPLLFLSPHQFICGDARTDSRDIDFVEEALEEALEEEVSRED